MSGSLDNSIVARDFAPTGPDPSVLARTRRRILEDNWASFPPPPAAATQSQSYSPNIPGPDVPAPVLFEDCRMTFAIDISQSTIGPVLAEECAFIKNFVGGLSTSAKDSARMIPWDEISHPIITLEELGNIKPAGRTDPNVLLQKREHIDLLQASHLWFLLTDGEIVPKTVHRFAFSINSRSLHGTACIIVIFGKLPLTPTLCNVSVGISVFAVTPNCLFVFHDVDTHLAYILQCKGCFNSLLPRGMDQTSLNSSTQWYNIPKLHYPDLFAIRIPLPVKLDVNQFQLQSGEKVDLEDLYHGKIGNAIEEKILQNDDNLKSVILTATTRGQNRDIRNWIANRRDSFADLVNMPRPDINGTAASLVTEATNTLHERDWRVNDFVFAKAATLRRAHALNWDAFVASAALRAKKVSQRSIVIDDGLARLDLIGRVGPSSAECMSPVSPRGGNSMYRSEAMDQGPCSRLLPSKGYILEEPTIYPNYKCSICQVAVAWFTILLKRPPAGSDTPGFPPPSSRAEIAFPLALGDFRETDIISNLTCCPSCSVHILEASGSNPIVGALVFGHNLSAKNTINQQTWMSHIDRALDGRVATECLLQAFFGIMLAAEEQTAFTNKTLSSTLGLACKMLMTGLQFQYEAGNRHWTGGATDVVQHHMSMGIASPACDFLNHPVDSFVIILSASSVPIAQKITALFFRLAFHIIEHGNTLQDSEHTQVSAKFCTMLRSRISDRDDMRRFMDIIDAGTYSSGEVPASEPAHVSKLLDVFAEHHLVDGKALSIFRRASKEGFDRVENSCKVALCLPHGYLEIPR
ncbi:hypothetical protein DL95DRAFT_528367 [Leptodontidium sp. 2 PMI_412]|nr:hypothetical protein DL95DRAFT_528367 [Leptodontidium sp. 2 PMI_412]